ncbi:saccharopine dehydrogenase family protein [Plastorhodobacter daqingensis]|uniref:Saccharopine dehydrogenase family protein n=1 Tax=Plastorhodobacter daqingensis TaxID=1387281 RepID=A0ABW2UMV9_9RHOB
MGRHQILVHGAGRMAHAIANTLAVDPRYAVLLSAPDPEPGHSTLPLLPSVQRTVANLSAAPDGQLSGLSAIIMAGDVWANTTDIARIAHDVGCHYLDISENPGSTAEIARLAEGARQCFVPACGLAPGYVTALTAERMRSAGPGAQVTAHVGVLPTRRVNRLGYGNLLGIDGLLVEYFSPCLAIREGRQVTLSPLAELESVVLAGEAFESFTTAGSLDALVRAPEVAVDGLVFKTLRYPGHLDYMRFLIDDLGLAQRRHQLRSLLMNGLPPIDEDRVLIALDIIRADGAREWFEQVIPMQPGPDGAWCSAGVMATAAHVCAMADLLCRGVLNRAGFLSQAAVSPRLLEQSPFFAPLAIAAVGAGADKNSIAYG